MTRCRTSVVLLLLAAVSSLVMADPVQSISIYHRMVAYGTPSSELPSWTKRGVWTPSSWSPERDAFVSLPEQGNVYHIGFGASKDEVKNFVSVPECHMHTLSTKPLQDTLVLILPTQSSSTPIHLRYSIEEADPTRCQPGNRAAAFNTTVKIEFPTKVAGPRLHQPVVVEYQEDGTVKEPEPEKSFIQKYWYYLLPIILLVLTSG